MNINQIFENNKKWISKRLQTDENFFTELAKGQSPDFLFIGCSDSRVPPTQLMGVGPGDVFVHRNIANVVSNSDANALTVIEYAVSILKVKYLAVCGHYGCGGVKAAMQTGSQDALNPWLNHIRDVYHLHKAELNNIKDEEEQYRRFVELNVQEQCQNLLKIPSVKQACSNHQSTIHGWVLDIQSGSIVDLNVDTDDLLEEIKDIY